MGQAAQRQSNRWIPLPDWRESFEFLHLFHAQFGTRNLRIQFQARLKLVRAQ